MLVLAALPALAVWTEIQITPKYMKSGDRSFTIHVKDRDGLKEFEIIEESTRKERIISPFAHANLTIMKDGESVGMIPVEVKNEAMKLTCWFRVSEKTIEGSRFELREQGFAPVHSFGAFPDRARIGNNEYEMTLGGQAFWFKLKDFATPNP